MQSTTGRATFSRVYWLLIVCTSAASCLPRFLRQWLWVWLDIVPNLLGIPLRYALLRSMLESCGDNVYIGRNVEIRNWKNLRLGNNISIHKGCYLDAAGGITIESDVSIAHACSLVSFDHTWDDESLPIKYNPITTKPITIDEDVWIGCGVRILGGVQIGSRSIVAAGAVVTKRIPSGSLAGGVPAKVIRSIV